MSGRDYKLEENKIKILEYIRKRTDIKEIPLGPISDRLAILHRFLEKQSGKITVELNVKWLKEMIKEVDENVQKLLKALEA